ncbi:hypothetical protein N9N28_05535 [Rubripirellula amarantea]|nr:hypothetical protein [Rubripirellula amarantea]
MTDSTNPGEEDSNPAIESEPLEIVDDGPGCMPAILAATALTGILGFVLCGFTTWVLFQKRTEMAVRTLRNAYVPELEQSLLDPDSKQGVIKQIKQLIGDMERGKYEDWQSAGVMQRLQRLPVLQWGDLQAVESFIAKAGSKDQATEAKRQFDRLRLAVRDGRATSFDFYDVLKPAQVDDPSASTGRRVMSPLKLEPALEVVPLARLLADREQVTADPTENVSIEAIVKAEIEAGLKDGTY